jgi:hypothetical protein
MADNLLRRTLVALAVAKVRFVVCGGVACVLQGVERTTHHLDVRVVLETPDLQALVGVARAIASGNASLSGSAPRLPNTAMSSTAAPSATTFACESGRAAPRCRAPRRRAQA